MTNQISSRLPETVIVRVRGQAVIFDTDLAALYGVTTKRLNEQIRRNRDRFPEDFAFQLTLKEWDCLRSQIATSKGRGGRRYLPCVLTEHGAIMAASVLNSSKAVEVSVFVVRAFVQLRQVIAGHKELADRIAQLERKLGDHDKQILVMVDAIKQLIDPRLPPKTRRIGFNQD